MSIHVEVMNAIGVANDDFTLTNLSNEFDGTIYVNEDRKDDNWRGILTTIAANTKILGDLNGRWTRMLNEIESNGKSFAMPT